MKTLYYKTPMARKEAWSYCRRALAFMLCLVLLSGFAMRTAPRAKAIAGEAVVTTTTVAGGVSLGPVLGIIALVGVGASILPGYFEHDNEKLHASIGYSIGRDCWNYLYGLGGDIADWCMTTESTYESKGGLQPGETVSIPAEVAELVRAWALDNINFADGSAVYTDRGLFSADSQLIFTAFPSGYAWNKVPASVVSLGNIVPFGGSASFLFTDADGVPWSLMCYCENDTQYYRFCKNGVEQVLNSNGANSLFFHLRELNGKCYLCVGVMYSSGLLQFTGEYWKKESELAERYPCIAVENILDLSTTITKAPSMDEPITDAQTVTVPATAPITYDASGTIAIPVPDVWTGKEVPDDTGDDVKPGAEGAIPWGELRDLLGGISDRVGAIPGSIADALPDALSQTMTDALAQSKAEAQAKAQEKAVEDALTAPDTLGGVFISKFPFCIPWDVVKAISLLAVPPVTPHWEIDFYEPLEGVGGFHAQGDTTVVIDFERFDFLAQVCRWVETCFFVYALAMGTKKLIWTA